MPAIDRLSSTPAFSWLRGRAGRVRRALRAQHPAARLGLVLAPVLLLAAAVYWAGTLAPSGPRLLAPGRDLSSEDLIRITKALDGKSVVYWVVDHKIKVAADQYDQAAAVLAKLDIGPRSISEIRESSDWIGTFVATQADRDRQDRLVREKLYERFIDDLDGVVGSVVCIQHPRAARTSRIKPSAFVYLESEADRPLPFKTVQAIPRILTSNEPGLAADAITVMDRKGRPYLDPSEPRLGKETRDLVREQELRDEVANRLDWIDGVRIWVKLDDRNEAAVARRPPAPAGRDATTREESSIAVNKPFVLETTPPPAPEPVPAEKPESGRVLVYVPRSFYYSRIVRPPDHRKPTAEELHEAVARTKDQIEGLIHPLIPTSWILDVGMIPDDLPAAEPPALASASDRRRLAADWGIVGAVAAGIALVMAMGSWIQAARRPAPAAASPTAGRRYREDPADEAGPSERVRELVRRDPEVAASVLQRWATQGGPAS